MRLPSQQRTCVCTEINEPSTAIASKHRGVTQVAVQARWKQPVLAHTGVHGSQHHSTRPSLALGTLL